MAGVEVRFSVCGCERGESESESESVGGNGDVGAGGRWKIGGRCIYTFLDVGGSWLAVCYNGVGWKILGTLFPSKT